MCLTEKPKQILEFFSKNILLKYFCWNVLKNAKTHDRRRRHNLWSTRSFQKLPDHSVHCVVRPFLDVAIRDKRCPQIFDAFSHLWKWVDPPVGKSRFRQKTEKASFVFKKKWWKQSGIIFYIITATSTSAASTTVAFITAACTTAASTKLPS